MTDVNSRTKKDDLIAFAEENSIDLGEATTQKDIWAVVKAWQDENSGEQGDDNEQNEDVPKGSKEVVLADSFYDEDGNIFRAGTKMYASKDFFKKYEKHFVKEPKKVALRPE